MGGLRRPGRPLVVLYVALSAFIVLNPWLGLPLAVLRAGEELLRTMGLSYQQSKLLEPAANVVLFVPIPWVIRLVAGRRRPSILAAWALACLLSVAIELVQGSVMPERTASLTDVATNTAGATLGALALLVAAVVRRRFSRAARSSATTTPSGDAAPR